MDKKKAAGAVKARVRAAGGAAGSFVKWLLRAVGTMLLVGITSSLMMAFLFMIYVNQYIKPNLELNMDDFSLNLTSFIYYTDANTGEVKELETLYNTENRVLVGYDDIPESLKNATIAIEDHRFPSHHGVDWKRTASAFVNIFLSLKSNFGGSTITQQLIKNLTDEKEVTVQRKVTEIFRALEFERHYSKEEILEGYLNTIYLGQGCNGVGTAAQEYFGKDVSKLTLAESAALIGITNAPTKYNPYLHPDNNKERQETILDRMLELGMIDQDEYDQAVAQKLVFKRGESVQQDDAQSYFVDQVINDVINDLVEQKGISEKAAEMSLYTAGYKIYTTINVDIQAVVDDIFTNEENFPEVEEDGSEKPQAAIAIMDPHTGAVVAMAGGRGQKQGVRTLNRATMTYRQPGSSIKPITVYGPALDMGILTPYSVYDDSPLRVENGKAWPKNYDFRYRGRMTVMKAVEISDNAVAARVVNDVTPERAFTFGSVNLGLSSLVREMEKNGKVYSDVNIAPMSLGGLTKGVSVEDMTAAYCAFVNEGVYTEARTYTRVEDADGNVILDNTPNSHVAMKEKTAYYMNTMLTNVVTNGTGAKAQLNNMTVAGKTGTTSDDNDRWFVGYTPYYAAAVWFGYDDPQEINLVKSTNPALTLWKLVMERVHENLESEAFFKPDGLVQANYCLDSGMAPSQYCRGDVRGSRVATGYFYPEDVPSQVCSMHIPVSFDLTTGQLATPFCPAETLGQKSLLNLTRLFEVGGVTVEDEQYTLRTYGEDAIPEGMYRAVTPQNKDGTPAVNSFCEVHTEEWAAQTPEEEPPVEESPPGGEETPPSQEESPPPDGGETTPTPSGQPGQ